MKNILFAICAMLLTAGVAQADTVPLDLPAIGDHADGTVFTTTVTVDGATFDIEYALTAFATHEATAGDAVIHGDNGFFGVHSDPDGGTAGQQGSIDGNDGEQISITGLAIAPATFDPGASGFLLSDFDVSFESISTLNANNVQDGVNLSHTGFGAVDTLTVLRPGNGATPAEIDVTGLAGNSTATSLFLAPDDNNSTNRWSINGISVLVTSPATAVPEPTALSLLGLGAIALLTQRRKRS